MENISDLVVQFIRTQEEADRLWEQFRRMIDYPSQATCCRLKAEAKQKEADSLLNEFRLANKSANSIF